MDWKQNGSRMKAEWKQNGDWKQNGSKMVLDNDRNLNTTAVAWPWPQKAITSVLFLLYYSSLQFTLGINFKL